MLAHLETRSPCFSRAVKRGARKANGIDQPTGDLLGLQTGVESCVGSVQIPALTKQRKSSYKAEDSFGLKCSFCRENWCSRGALTDPGSHS